VIQLKGVAKAYGGQVLFRDLSWRIAGRERIGLVGPNGAGKTTLCRLVAGDEEPDAGSITRDRGTTIGYLPQEVAAPTLTSGGSVLAEALAGFDRVFELEREMEAIAARLETAPSEALTARYGELQHAFDALGGYRLEAEARAVLGGLGFPARAIDRPLREFSGGFRMRAALARLLLVRPSLLLLDEPTNHLDLESLAWLEGYLAAYDGAVVVVSHDRYFLNRMVTAIAEVSAGGLALYTGGYDDYLVERQARRALAEARARNQAKQVAEIERFVERFRYKATKARQVQSRIKMLERMEAVELDAPTREIRLAFAPPPRTGRRVASLAGIHKAYGDHVVYAGVDLEVERGDRIALVGPNGAGKSTLLRILAGVLPFDRGERTLGAHVTVHYYAQHQLDQLHPEHTVLEELAEAAPDAGHTRLRTILGAFLFSGDAVDKRVSVLSGGEKARVALARMLGRPAAFLCLDEPTNHLDLASRERLEAALEGFAGTIVFISHDRYFINRLATKVVAVAGGRLTTHLGGYDDYQAAVSAAAAGPRPERGHGPASPGPAARNGPPATIPPAPAPGQAAAAPRRERRARVDPTVRAQRRRVETLEGEIHALEQRIEKLGLALGDPSLYADGDRVRAVTAERQEAETELAWLLREWEDLSTALERTGP
jgi:ATP-binding cassette subfamily F protein 3